jgi:glycosyltransferase involved in cell wall biosynthesis
VIYVSYDGMSEPLGRSQVLAYLTRLSQEFEITLISFEKDMDAVREISAELLASGISWRPLAYHKRPPVLSTLLDALQGARAIITASSSSGRPDIVHVRSYVPALMALWARRRVGGALIFDIRGFWADERVEGGIWPKDSAAYRALYRLAKFCEARFFKAADAVVTLTHASVPQIRTWLRGRDIEVVVIPTCTDVERYAGTRRRDGPAQLVWCGSVGTWYRFDLAPRVAEELGVGLEVLTRQQELASEVLAGRPAIVREVPSAQVPDALHAGDIGLSLCVSAFSKIASTPTRFAEYLAAGMPVLVTRGIGDLDEIVDSHRVGVVLEGDDRDSVDQAVAGLRELLADEQLVGRCRDVSSQLFGVDHGARAYGALYRRLIER